MEDYIETKEVYTIDKQAYKVISRVNKKENINGLYEVLGRYALQKLRYIN